MSKSGTPTTLPPWLGGVIFVAGFLVTSVAFALVASSPLPLPTAADEIIAQFYQKERGALWLAGASHLLSVLGLVIFVRGTRAVINSPWVTVAFLVAVASMTLTGLLTWVTATFAPQLSATAVAILVRTVFYLGGVVHVVALGGFVAAALRASPLLRANRAIQILGVIAALVACASVLSIFVAAAAPLLPAGRVLCMIWILSLGLAWRRIVKVP